MYEYEATVTRVVDGDTLDLIIDLGLDVFHNVRVRLYGVNTPETYGVSKDSSEYRRGSEAADYVRFNCEKREVRVKTIKDRKGKYGRYLAVVFFKTGETWHNLNQQLVELQMGLADENYQRAAICNLGETHCGW